jgi:hypothetical protein
MQAIQKRYTAVAGVLSAILTTTCWSHDLVPPCWRDTGGSTFQRWTFNTNDNPASPELNHNSYGSPQASITLGPFGSGWQWDLGFGTNRGYWDLGSNGSITLSIPNDPTAPAGAWKYMWVQMTYWDDPPLFVAPAVSVSGATLLATSNLVVEQTFMGRWSLQQTLWRLDSSPNAETVTLTAAANGGVVDQVVVDTKWIKIDCPADLVFEADPGQCSKANVTYVGLPEVDGCVVTNVSCSPPNGSTFPVGTTPVSCAIWDGGGKTLTCSFTVTVNDTQPPVASCPADISVDAESGQCSATVTYTATVTDNCPGATITCNPPSGSSFPVGQTTVTCTATDAAGNHATCSFTVTVNDTQAPVATCPQDITVPAAEGQCSAIVTYSASASDNCPGASISCDPPSGSSFPVGQTTVTCTATDAAGNHATCSFTVTVNDTQAPVATCPQDITVPAAEGQCSAIVTYSASASDNCPGASISCDPPSGSSFPVGQTTVTCTATDAAGNHATCSFTVTVNDTQAPVATCPQDITVPAAEGQCSAIVTYSASASDNCPGASISCDPPSGSSFPVGQTTVTCTATDAAGNHATCSFTVTVNDTQAPVATCPQDITVPAAEGQCSAIVTYSASASDNCPGASISCDPPSGSSFPVGQTTVTCTATDAAGNHATCSFTVTVTDEGAPVLGLITATQQQSGGTVDVKDCANPTLVGTVHITVQASDACGLAGPPTVELKLGSEIQIATLVEENPAGTFNYTWEVTDQTANGTWTATVTAQDAAGNKATADFTLCVSARQVTGVVQYSTLSETSYSVERGVVFVATDAQGTVLKRWTLSLTFQNDPSRQSASATYALTDVPADTANLSAKTAWHLRKRLPVAFGQSGQAQVNFELLGGDLDGSNTTDIYDYARLRDNWQTSNAVADINGDGQVQLLDYAILRDNWYRAGDSE